MMGLSSPVTTSTVNDALALINVMLDPQQAKRTLTELSEQIDKLEKARAEATAEQQRASRDRAEADKRIAEAETRVGAIQAREQAVTAREEQAERVRTLVREKLAGVEA
jgi:chromosome segregation ATPase